MKTSTNNEIRISSNKTQKTFTIRKNGLKYRTYPMTKHEFNHALRNWTINDWKQFLKTDEYYFVK